MVPFDAEKGPRVKLVKEVSNMSIEKKLTLRVTILSILLIGVFVGTKADAVTPSCLSTCFAEFRACTAACEKLPHQPSEGCTDFCTPELEQCEAGC
jgi:hypothetical protein